jgi:hypothetical protein
LPVLCIEERGMLQAAPRRLRDPDFQQSMWLFVPGLRYPDPGRFGYLPSWECEILRSVSLLCFVDDPPFSRYSGCLGRGRVPASSAFLLIRYTSQLDRSRPARKALVTR